MIRRKSPPAARNTMVKTTTVDADPSMALQRQQAGIDQVERSVGQLQKLTAAPPTVTGSKGANAALASLITALAGLGLIKDGTT